MAARQAAPSPPPAAPQQAAICAVTLLDTRRRRLSQPLVSARQSPQVRAVVCESAQNMKARKSPCLADSAHKLEGCWRRLAPGRYSLRSSNTYQRSRSGAGAACHAGRSRLSRRLRPRHEWCRATRLVRTSRDPASHDGSARASGRETCSPTSRSSAAARASSGRRRSSERETSSRPGVGSLVQSCGRRAGWRRADRGSVLASPGRPVKKRTYGGFARSVPSFATQGVLI